MLNLCDYMQVIICLAVWIQNNYTPDAIKNKKSLSCLHIPVSVTYTLQARW